MNTSPQRQLKDYKTLQEQIELLTNRGMIINDEELAAKWLREIGYYRLSLYTYHFRKSRNDRNAPHTFRDGSTFENIVALYIFDRELRYRVFTGIEKIEVALRAHIGYILGSHGPDVHLKPQFFRKETEHNKLIAIFQRRFDLALNRNDEVATYHQNHYGGQLPFWVLTDLLDFADLSKLFKQLVAAEQRDIAQSFGLNDPPQKRNARMSNLAGWLHQLVLVRNFTAHHGRLWDRKLGAQSVTDAKNVHGFFEDFREPAQSNDLYGILTIMAFLLHNIEGNTAWAKNMSRFLADYEHCLPSQSLTGMGFPEHWQSIHPWNS